MNRNRSKGYQRDKQILKAIEKHRVLSTDQVFQLFFTHLKQGKRICQRRLHVLYSESKLKRHRNILEQPFYYFLEEYKQLEHIVQTNDVYIYLKNSLPDWESISHLSFENDYGVLRSDAFIGIKNNVTSKQRFYFVEVDISENKFDKVDKYNQLYEQKHEWWWVKYADKFPGVIVKTTRPKVVQKALENNKNNIDFIIL